MTFNITKSTKTVGGSPLLTETEAKILDGLIMPFWVIPRLLQRNVALLEVVGDEGVGVSSVTFRERKHTTSSHCLAVS